MPLLIFDFIRQNRVAVIIGLLIAVIIVQYWRIDYVSTKLTACKSTILSLENANRNMRDAITVQNEAITHLHTAGKQKADAAAKSRIKAQAQAKQYHASAQAIKASAITGNECADMLTLINHYLK